MSRLIVQATDRLKNKLASHDIIGLRWLIDGFNLKDKSRVKEIGPDRAAAEWIVKCGGTARFDKWNDEFNDWNTLIRATAELDPRKPSDRVRLIEIDATDSSVSGFGCMHFEGLEHILSAKFVRCKQLQDFGIEYMAEYAGDRLACLTLESCPRITEYGLDHLKKFSVLESLLLKDLKRVHGGEAKVAELRRALPKCDIHYSP